MTPKEKAEELVSRYRKEILKGKYHINGFVIEELAEESALIAVDEIIETLNSPPIRQGNENHMLWKATLNYWEQVKQEIEKL